MYVLLPFCHQIKSTQMRSQALPGHVCYGERSYGDLVPRVETITDQAVPSRRHCDLGRSVVWNFGRWDWSWDKVFAKRFRCWAQSQLFFVLSPRVRQPCALTGQFFLGDRIICEARWRSGSIHVCHVVLKRWFTFSLWATLIPAKRLNFCSQHIRCVLQFIFEKNYFAFYGPKGGLMIRYSLTWTLFQCRKVISHFTIPNIYIWECVILTLKTEIYDHGCTSSVILRSHP